MSRPLVTKARRPDLDTASDKLSETLSKPWLATIAMLIPPDVTADDRMLFDGSCATEILLTATMF
jgi:hypothetical protein